MSSHRQLGLAGPGDRLWGAPQWVLAIGVVMAAPLRGQWLLPTDPTRSLQIYGGSVYAGAANRLISVSGLLPGGPVGWDGEAGGAVTLGWRRRQSTTKYSAFYTASYNGSARYAVLRSLNHSLSLEGSRRMAGRWKLGFSVAAVSSGVAQYVFSPLLRSVVGEPVPAGLRPPAAGSGEPATLEPPVGDTPLRTLLYGTRSLNASASSSLSYSHSPRLSVHTAMTVDRSQPLSRAQDNGGAPFDYLELRTTGVQASAGLSYSVTPRTQTGFDLSVSRRASAFEDAYLSTAVWRLRRTLRGRWFWQGHAGVAAAKVLRQLYGTAPPPGYLAGNTVGLRTGAQSFSVAHERAVLDRYGLGADSTSSLSAGWNWALPWRRWEISGKAARQVLSGSLAQGFRGWLVSAAVNRRLTRYTSWRLEYAYLLNSGNFAAISNRLSFHSARISFVWTAPQEGFR